MINDIITSISKAIDLEFNPDNDTYEIYSEDVSQGLNEPCFSIVSLLSLSTKRLKPRYLRSYSFDVHYFPLDKINSKNECFLVAERLLLCLEFLNDTYRGINMSYEVIDNVLHFFVTYQTYVTLEIEREDNMDTISTNMGVK